MPARHSWMPRLALVLCLLASGCSVPGAPTPGAGRVPFVLPEFEFDHDHLDVGAHPGQRLGFEEVTEIPLGRPGQEAGRFVRVGTKIAVSLVDAERVGFALVDA